MYRHAFEDALPLNIIVGLCLLNQTGRILWLVVCLVHVRVTFTMVAVFNAQTSFNVTYSSSIWFFCCSDFLDFHFNVMYMGAAAHMVHHLIVNEFMCCSTSIANELQLKHDCCSHVLC